MERSAYTSRQLKKMTRTEQTLPSNQNSSPSAKIPSNFIPYKCALYLNRKQIFAFYRVFTEHIPHLSTKHSYAYKIDGELQTEHMVKLLLTRA